ncbi:MAG TPA: ABC transporter ATP-binding protein [Acidimicrobiia bacterium]|jgi:ABC-2 type transport system ATP-binding protein|nr:ABC transporter ATP-binding protein [Acidimicrobiia bacterium]
MSATIEVNGLSKWFGNKVAVSELSVNFSPGITGLLGPNGAGKTTMMRVVAGLQVPSQGSVSILGKDPRTDPEIYRKVALVPEDEAVYGHLTASQFVTLAARLSGIDNIEGRVVEAIHLVEMSDSSDRKLDGFSKGMRQRIKVAAALVSDPEILLLDEPLNGADPVQRARLIALFRRLGEEGKTVLVSSHILAEVERMTDQVVAMVDGRLAAMGHISEIRAAMSDKPRRVYIETDQTRRLGSALIQLDGVVGIELDEDRLTLQVTDAQGFARGIPKILADGNYDVTRIEPTDESLESVFRYLVEGE